MFPRKAALLLLLLAGGCAAPPVQLGDGRIEPPLATVTGLTTEDLERTSQKMALGLWDVYALAVDRTESLAQKAEDIEQAEAQGQQAVAAILPQVTLNGAKGWQSDRYVGSNTTIFNNLASTSVYLSGTETLFSGLDQVAALQGAQALKDKGRHRLRQGSRDLLLDLAKAFYAALQAQDSLKAKQEILKLTEQILKQEQQWRAIGRSRDSDVLSTEAELARLNGDLESIQNQLTQARGSLAVLAGLKPDQELVSEERVSPPAFGLPEAESRIGQRPDVQAAEAGVALAEAALLAAHGEHLPSLSVQGNYFLLKEGGSPVPEWNVQVVASLPVFEGGGILAREREVASKKRQAELDLSLVRRQALEDIRSAYRNLTSSLRQVEAYDKALEAARKDYEAVARDRRLALNTNLDLLNALSSLQNAENNSNQAHYQALVNEVWLGVAVGDLPKSSPRP